MEAVALQEVPGQDWLLALLEVWEAWWVEEAEEADKFEDSDM